MTVNEFIKQLSGCYPEGLRPDAVYISQLRRFLARKQLVSDQAEAVIDRLVSQNKMFPGFMEIEAAFREAKNTKYRELISNTAYEYFYLDGKPYRRKVAILDNGTIDKKELPEGATGCFLELPAHMRAENDHMTFQEAYENGVIPNALFDQMTLLENTKQPVKGRFERIGEIIKTKEDPIGWDDL